MNELQRIRGLFGTILVLMIVLTAWASQTSNVLDGFRYLFADRWGIATLGDSYCGFITFCSWLVYKERTPVARVIWVFMILVFGNIAMAIYVLHHLRRLPKGARIEDLLLRVGSRTQGDA